MKRNTEIFGLYWNQSCHYCVQC